MNGYTSMKIKKEILLEMQEVKEETGIAIYKLFEKAWQEYKKSKEDMKIGNEKK